MNKSTKIKITVLCGPTASGKTASAIDLALKIDAEIISADSGQIYRGMDIGTAKPVPEERRRVPFHLVDILNPDEVFSAADFRCLAAEAIDEIRSRGRSVLVVGGTGLYLMALERGLFEGPSRDPEVRKELERRLAEEGREALHAELQRVDPKAAAAIPLQNRQRLVRALEVYQLAGRPISEFWREHQKIPPDPPFSKGGTELSPPFSKGGWGDFKFVKFGLVLPREELHRRIDERVDRMIESGLIEEVRRLVEQWGREVPGLRLIGYKEIVSYLQGEVSLDEAVSRVKKNTRQYAKRQMTWFRRDKEIQWVHDLGEASVS